jgi:hypothetical protein
LFLLYPKGAELFLIVTTCPEMQYRQEVPDAQKSSFPGCASVSRHFIMDTLIKESDNKDVAEEKAEPEP